MGRRRIPRQPEVKVAVRTEVHRPSWADGAAFAAVSLLVAWMASLWWTSASQLAH